MIKYELNDEEYYNNLKERCKNPIRKVYDDNIYDFQGNIIPFNDDDLANKEKESEDFLVEEEIER